MYSYTHLNHFNSENMPFEEETSTLISSDNCTNANFFDQEIPFRKRARTWPNVTNVSTNPVYFEYTLPTQPYEYNYGTGDVSSVCNLENASSSGSKTSKKSSRRNAWGNQSYADIITMAIESSKDKRLTLAQIYEFMTSNIPYFREKKDNNSASGWKNSIRHNLSLHSRFQRVQNEGTSKSSWWTINKNVEVKKSMRRRANTLDPKILEKKKNKSKKVNKTVKEYAFNVCHDQLPDWVLKNYKNSTSSKPSKTFTSDRKDNSVNKLEYSSIIQQLKQKISSNSNEPTTYSQDYFPHYYTSLDYNFQYESLDCEKVQKKMFDELVVKNDFPSVENYSNYLDIFNEKLNFD